VSTHDIYEKYLQKAITEINELGDEIADAATGVGVPVVGSGHPLADVFMLKYGPQAAEGQEGVAFFGRAGQAILKSLQRLSVDPLAVYGTNCLKFAGEPEEEAQQFLARELHIVGPKLLVPMGEDTLRFLNELAFPLSRELTWEPGSFQQWTPTIEALVCPDIDASLDDQPAKSAFWDAFKKIDEWWAKLPPY
jgi:uracil-DNA glycosylase family 4